MTVQLAAVTFDCDDAMTVGRFWAAALDRPLDGHSTRDFATIGMAEDHAVGGSNAWMFARVPESKVAKNRVHIDFAADDSEAEVNWLIGLGAKRVDDKREWNFAWTIMQDPEGNEFCVAQTP
ncbi:VOC family protein [Solicola gregarius]|uniref:VOC family protein n=1 Tax=Solicola gregarius TaxID=2908642 RepID=A0AA46YLE8_9ACTN|nr:VOC family protein [Solicola gregarius]UYM04798.1 VOC family protein [Solicola gregarius]